jgi:hypothetical protein
MILRIRLLVTPLQGSSLLLGRPAAGLQPCEGLVRDARGAMRFVVRGWQKAFHPLAEGESLFFAQFLRLFAQGVAAMVEVQSVMRWRS